MSLTVGHQPDRVDIVARVGAPLNFVVTLLPSGVDLTGYTVVAQIRENVIPAAALLFTLTTVIGSGTVTVSATAAQTALWSSWPGARAVWDLVLTSSGGVPTPVAAGWITVYPRVTQ